VIGIVLVVLIMLLVPAGWLLWGLGYQRGKLEGIAEVMGGAAVDRCEDCGKMVRAFWPARIWNSNKILCDRCFDVSPEEQAHGN